MNSFEQYRSNQNLSQEFAAGKLGVDQTTVSKWERGHSLPRAELLPKIAALYRCTVDELLAEDSTT